MSKIVLPWADADRDGNYDPLSPHNPLYVIQAANDETNINYDLFSRLRVCNPETLFDGNFSVPQNTLRWKSAVTGTGAAAAQDTTNNVYKLSTTASTLGSATVQSRRHVTYQPGKTMVALISCCPLPLGAAAGATARVGYYSAEDGVFVEFVDGTTPRLVIRRRSVDYPVARAAWNGDKMDGSGTSGITLDFTKQQILFISFKWLGSGNVRFGSIVDNHPITWHTFQHTNSYGAIPYWRSASLPVRAELSNTSADTANRSLHLICCSVVSEGGYNPRGLVFSQPRMVRCENVDEGLYTAVLAIRLRSSASSAVTINIQRMSTLVKDDVKMMVFGLWRILSPTAGALLTSGTWTPVNVGSSACEYNEYSTGGLDGLQSPFTVGGHAADSTTLVSTVFDSVGSTSVDNAVQLLLSKDINGVSDIAVITARSADGDNRKVIAALGWQELS